jgi:hypothetical protein
LNTHNDLNERKIVHEDHNNITACSYSKLLNIEEATSSEVSEIPVVNVNQITTGANPQNVPTSLSSAVQAKKGNKSSRGKSKNKGGGGFNHRQFIDAALTTPMSSSRNNNSNDFKQNNPSDSNKLKISNTFVAEALLPEPVLEYSRNHSSHSPPPPPELNTDLKNTDQQEASGNNPTNLHQDTNYIAPEQKNERMTILDGENSTKTIVKEHDTKMIFNNSDSAHNSTTANSSIAFEENTCVDWNEVNVNECEVMHRPKTTNDCLEKYSDVINENSSTLPFNNKYPKSYSSAVTASVDSRNTTTFTSSKAFSVDGKNVNMKDSEIERNSETDQSGDKTEEEEFDEPD